MVYVDIYSNRIKDDFKKFQKPTIVLVHNTTLAGQLYREFKNMFPSANIDFFVSYHGIS